MGRGLKAWKLQVESQEEVSKNRADLTVKRLSQRLAFVTESPRDRIDTIRQAMVEEFTLRKFMPQPDR